MVKNKKDSTRRKFIKNSTLMAVGVSVMPGNVASIRNLVLQSPGKIVYNRITDALFINDYAEVKGYIGNKLYLSYENRILAQDDESLIEPFRHRTETRLWQTEFWGKWFTSAVLAYRYHRTRELKEKLDRSVSSLISTQTSDGYIGNYSTSSRLEQWDIWGMKYSMMGLLDYYDLTGSKKSLKTACKLADYVVSELQRQHKSIVQTGNYRGMASSSILGPICHLYRKTGKSRYLNFALNIVEEWETDEGPRLISKASINVGERFPKPERWYSPEQGQKAYEMMSCYEGLLELYRITGTEAYKEAALKTWDNINSTEINIAGSGASAECWFGGKELQTWRIYHYQETCVSVTWIRFSLNLFKLTGEVKYADEIERTYFNALLGSMYPDGADWAKYTPLVGQRLPGSGQCGMKLNCCNANGPRGLFVLPSIAVMKKDDGIFINFYAEGMSRLFSPKGQVIKIIQHTNYPISGEIDIKVEILETEEMTVGIRIPEWSKRSQILINGKTMSNVVPGNYVKLKRSWKNGDNISLKLDMRGRVLFLGGRRKFAAIMKGPVVLSRDSRYAEDEIINTVMPVVDEDGYIDLSMAQEKDEAVWARYTALFLPEAYTEEGTKPISLPLVDYSSAGYARNNPTYCVWIPQVFNPQEDI